jgi:hypothetical protein
VKDIKKILIDLIEFITVPAITFGIGLYMLMIYSKDGITSLEGGVVISLFTASMLITLNKFDKRFEEIIKKYFGRK